MRTALIGFMVILVACNEAPRTPGKQPPAVLPRPYLFDFQTVAAFANGEVLTIFDDGDMTCSNVPAGKVCADFDEIFVSFEFTNLSSDPATVLWSGARWIDEFGKPHLLARRPGHSTSRDHIVQPGEVHRVTHFPREKNYLVSDSKDAYYFSEPIVPWDMRTGNPDEKRRQLALSKTLVFLDVPIETHGARTAYRFAFQIFPANRAEVAEP